MDNPQQESSLDQLVKLINDYFAQEKGNKVTDYNFPNLGNKIIQLHKKEVEKLQDEIDQLKANE